MNEVILITNTGDIIHNVIQIAMEIVKIKGVSHVMFEFNNSNMCVKKDSTEESIMKDYMSNFEENYLKP